MIAMKKAPRAEDVLRAVRAYCLGCSGGSKQVVETCILHNCPLYPYRSVSAIQEIAGGCQMDMLSYVEVEEKKDA